jgi:hypothetical protein
VGVPIESPDGLSHISLILDYLRILDDEQTMRKQSFFDTALFLPLIDSMSIDLELKFLVLILGAWYLADINAIYD